MSFYMYRSFKAESVSAVVVRRSGWWTTMNAWVMAWAPRTMCQLSAFGNFAWFLSFFRIWLLLSSWTFFYPSTSHRKFMMNRTNRSIFSVVYNLLRFTKKSFVLKHFSTLHERSKSRRDDRHEVRTQRIRPRAYRCTLQTLWRLSRVAFKIHVRQL